MCGARPLSLGTSLRVTMIPVGTAKAALIGRTVDSETIEPAGIRNHPLGCTEPSMSRSRFLSQLR